MAQKFLTPIDLTKNELQNTRVQNLASAPSSPVTGQIYYDTTLNQFGCYQNATWVYLSTAGGGTVTSISVTSANGFAGSSSGGTTPALTISTTISGVLKGNGTAISAATAGTDYITPSGTETLSNKTIGNTNAITVKDGSFTIQNTTDATKQLVFSLAGITTATTRTLTIPNVSGTIITTGDSATVTNTMLAGLIAASKLVGTDIATVGTITAGTWTATAIGSQYGGTGQNFSASSGILKYTTGTASLVTAPTGAIVGTTDSQTLTTKTIDASSNTISNLTTSMFAANVVDNDATLAANSSTRIPTQAAVLGYVQANIQGIQWKAPVRAATAAAGTLATSFANGQVVDGVTLVTGDRILIKNQATASENGIYTVNASGAPTRAVDADANTEIKGLVVDVLEGTANADTAWINTNTGTVTLGTTGLTFVDFVKANVPTATTSVQGKVFLATQAEAEAKADTSKAVVSADLLNFPIKKVFTIGDGTSTSLTCTHSLGTQDVQVQIRDASTNAVVYADIVNTSTSVTTITFATAPASNAYKVVIIG